MSAKEQISPVTKIINIFRLIHFKYSWHSNPKKIKVSSTMSFFLPCEHTFTLNILFTLSLIHLNFYFNSVYTVNTVPCCHTMSAYYKLSGLVFHLRSVVGNVLLELYPKQLGIYYYYYCD